MTSNMQNEIEHSLMTETNGSSDFASDQSPLLGSGEFPSTGSRNTTRNQSRNQPLTTSIEDVPVTVLRRPFIQDDSAKNILLHIGTARANIAATSDHVDGTTEDSWAERHRHQTVLQQHCEFFDTDRDGIIWPLDTYRGFRKLGFNVALSILTIFIINLTFSYPTLDTYIPDPLFRIHIARIHKDKHGSDSGTYDNEGRFIPQKFEDIFAKYAGGRDYITFREAMAAAKGQRVLMDPVGSFGVLFEWIATYIMLWPKDGRMQKEDIRRIYDGSLFFKIAEKRAAT